MFARLLITKAKESWANKIVENKVLEKLSHIAPALVIYSLAPLFNIKGLEFTETIEYIQKTLALLYIIATLTYTAIAGLDSIEDIYETYDVAKKRPIKSYLQVIKLILFIIALIFQCQQY